MGQLGSCTTTIEPVLESLGDATLSPRAAATEACIPCSLCFTREANAMTSANTATTE